VVIDYLGKAIIYAHISIIQSKYSHIVRVLAKSDDLRHSFIQLHSKYCCHLCLGINVPYLHQSVSCPDHYSNFVFTEWIAGDTYYFLPVSESPSTQFVKRPLQTPYVVSSRMALWKITYALFVLLPEYHISKSSCVAQHLV